MESENILNLTLGFEPERALVEFGESGGGGSVELSTSSILLGLSFLFGFQTIK
jgi:hypothetical protein